MEHEARRWERIQERKRAARTCRRIERVTKSRIRQGKGA
jgi:hypothetical protein